MKFLDPDDAFFAPKWRRWVTVLFPMVWGAFELYNGSPGWAVVFAAAGAYAFYMLFLKPPEPASPTEAAPNTGSDQDTDGQAKDSGSA